MSSREVHFRGIVGVLVVAALSFSASYSRAQVLTRERIAELVKGAPEPRVAQSEAAVSGAAVTAAGVITQDNPLISGMGGVRFNPDGTRPFSGVATLSWPVDLGGKRSARVAAAKAEHRAALASAKGTERRVLLSALLQHTLVLRGERQRAIAAARHLLSERVYAAAQRRFAAGGVPELDVALAGMQEKRDASAEKSAIGVRDGDKLVLLTLLGLTTDMPVSGALVPEGDPPSLSELNKRVKNHPDVRVASAALDAARANAARERSSRWPTISILAQYERDDRANIGLIGLAVPLPVLNANKAGVVTSAAEVAAAKARSEKTRGAATGQLKGLYARYKATKAAMDSLAPTAALATRAVKLATRGYELGENDLASVLLVRREAIETDEALLEAEYAHAAAKIELIVAAGRVPR